LPFSLHSCYQKLCIPIYQKLCIVIYRLHADYGKQIIQTLSAQLETKYGKNFELRNLRRMLQFAEQFADHSIVVTLSRQSVI